MKSEVDVRYKERVWFRGANLIVDQGIANVFHQNIKHLCVLGVIKEIHKIVSGRDRVHSLANLLQFPGNLCTSEVALDP